MAEKILETSNALFAETLAQEKILQIDDGLAQKSNVSIAKAIAQESIVPIAKEHAKEFAKDSIGLIADALAQEFGNTGCQVFKQGVQNWKFFA